mgnify:CR=1 FL=1
MIYATLILSKRRRYLKMVQLISRNEEKGTAQIVVKEKGVSTTLHLRRERGAPGIFKTADMLVEETNEDGEIVTRRIPGEEFDLSGLRPLINTPSRPSNPEKGQGKGGVKKSREQKQAEKDAARKPAGRKGKDA